MSRTVFPPTPGSSTDIKGADGTKQLDSLQMTFVLPEPALAVADTSSQLTPPKEILPTKTAYTQPSETVKSRRRSSAAQPPKDQFALPPPPTRSRKIIQMKPRPQEDTSSNIAKNAAASKAVAGGAGTPATASTGNKRKQSSTSSAAGRKIARKTAHSLIERRRRSKMNEEFALLKSMIPACSGEMHKLAILQASIEYVRYLEDCVAKLKARHTEPDLSQDDRDVPSQYIDEPFRPQHNLQDLEEESSPDVDMEEGSEIPSPALTATHHSRSQQPSVSPVLLAQDAQSRHNSQSSLSSASTTDRRYYDYSAPASASTSPAFGPQAYHYAHSAHSAAGSSALTSPALGPQRDMDQEATAALLMLNQSDRRGTNGSSGRGMSVRDLLST
ncbi:hypothetical protein CONLIGDRAFT_675479 [Coniochaeta ligniaria NRRL 30616]|uniref:BHLH domain-containing protein n=1 Tax=Coniochaeta ligniaria NRRL 30616 TaxID=1408157 RepID=A0A1J7J327_9PEZI|nr:hypothetical protein CONLIGDRAFT_675479 [Coniochaeta ligniaria NRRL 30616]